MLVHYTEFLQLNVTPVSKYISLFPSLYDLVSVYHLDPESVFGIFRPFLPLLFPFNETEKVIQHLRSLLC